jgi:hypothetical protein
MPATERKDLRRRSDQQLSHFRMRHMTDQDEQGQAGAHDDLAFIRPVETRLIVTEGNPPVPRDHGKPLDIGCSGAEVRVMMLDPEARRS